MSTEREMMENYLAFRLNKIQTELTLIKTIQRLLADGVPAEHPIIQASYNTLRGDTFKIGE